MRNFRVQRALVVDDVIINLGDTILVQVDEMVIMCILENILWRDEYTAVLHTDAGEFSTDEITSVIRL